MSKHVRNAKKSIGGEKKNFDLEQGLKYPSIREKKEMRTTLFITFLNLEMVLNGLFRGCMGNVCA